MSGNIVENSDNERQRECPRCSRLENQLRTTKEISKLRTDLLDVRQKEAKELIAKLKFFEEAIEIEKNLRLTLSKRVEAAEQHCVLLTGNLERNVASLGEMQASYDNRIAGLVSNLETSDEQLADYKQQLSASQERNDELSHQLSGLDKLVTDSRNAVRKLENQLKVTVDRNKVLSYQMSLLNNLFDETDLVLIDFDKIKAIGDIVRETHNLPEIQIQTDEDGDRRLSIDIENVIEKIDNDKVAEDIPGEESCYKSVDTLRGPQLVLSVSRTFIKLKDLILEKKDLQREIDTLKTLNSKLETKVDKQERRLYCVTVELNKTWNLVSKLKVQHNKLHTNEAVLKYELSEKRRQLEKLKVDLSSCREKWLKVRQKNSESQIVWNNLRDEFSRRKQESSQESAFSENMSSSSANEDEEGAPVIVAEEVEGEINEGYEPEGAYGITLIPDEEIVEDYMDPLEDMVSDLVEEIEATAAEGDAEDEGIDDTATSSEESSSERVIRRANRLRMLEEQCHLLHSKLLASTARSAALASKLAALHNHYGSRDSDPENSENYEQDTSRTGEASTSAYTADTEATVNQTRSDVYDTEMPSSENGSQFGGEIPVIINHSENNDDESGRGIETVHNAEIVLDIVAVPLVDFVDSLPNSEIVLQPIVHEVDVTGTTDNLPLRDSVLTPNLIITTHNPPLHQIAQDVQRLDLDQQNNNIYEDRQFGMQLQVQIDTEDEIGDSADLLSEFDVSREQSQSPLQLQLETGSGIDYVDADNEIGNGSDEDNDDEAENHRENSSSSEGSFSGVSPDPNYLGRLIIKQLPLRLEILKRENQALMKEAVEVKLEMKETERLLRQQVSKHKKANDKLKTQIENRNLVEFELREELGHKEQTIEELHKEIQDAKTISENFKRKEDVINDFIKKVAEEKLILESSKVALKSVKTCPGCDNTFSLLRRKSHCSVCNQVFCKMCVPKRKSSSISISQTRLKTKQRTCTSCEDRREQINVLAAQITDTNF